MSKLSIKRPEKVVPLCLDASLRAEWEKASADLAKVGQESTGRLTGNAEAGRLAEVVRDVEARMLAEVVRFRLRGLRRDVWAALVAEHPARDGVAEDRAYGVNTATFFDAVMVDAVVDVTDNAGEPVEFAPADWQGLADEMTNGQYAEFVDALLELNKGATGVPFSRAAASLRNPASSETSN